MTPQDPPPRTTGLAHLMAATRYSVKGLRRLCAEAAFRQELAGAVVVLVVLWLVGAPVWALALQAILLLVLFAVEALNTALEELVDHLTRDWAAFAAHAKDLGSLAVACLLLANGICAMLGLWMALAG